MKRIVSIFAFIVISVTSPIAQPRWSMELHGGGVFNLPIPLIIKQNGFQDIKLTARYSTEPFTLPIYYDIRFSRWQDGKSWELEMIHHKLYLENTTQEVQKFNISHGFNIFFLNRGIEVNSFRYRAGVGMVIAHPESTIRGQKFGSSSDDNDFGYLLSGPAINVAAGRPFYLGKKFFINAEAKTTLAYASIKIVQGRADVYNIAFIILLGLGMNSR